MDEVPAANNRPSLWRRLAAMGYDTLLVVPLMMAVTALDIGLRAAIVGAETIQHSQGAALTGTWYWLNLLVACGSAVGFFLICWCRGGKTLGMQAWRLRIQQADGRLITPTQGLARLGGAAISLGCLGLGYLWILVDKERRSWHDIWSGTQVVLLPKPARPS